MRMWPGYRPPDFKSIYCHLEIYQEPGKNINVKFPVQKHYLCLPITTIMDEGSEKQNYKMTGRMGKKLPEGEICLKVKTEGADVTSGHMGYTWL